MPRRKSPAPAEPALDTLPIVGGPGATGLRSAAGRSGRLDQRDAVGLEEPDRVVAAATTLHAAAIHLLRALAPVDERSGLSPARLSALSVVVFGGPVPIGRLARVEGVSGPTMTRIVDGLVGDGLVRRRPDPTSARVVLVEPTARGRRLMTSARRRRVAEVVAGLDTLGARDRAAVVGAADAFGHLAAAVSRRHTGGVSAGPSRVG